MSALFKGSCSFFWLVWMITMSYLFGILLIEEKYTYLSGGSQLAGTMIVACVTVTSMAFIGCCCVKCDVTHVCCAIWYIVPTVLIPCLLCIGILVVLETQYEKELKEGDVLQIVLDELHSKNQIPTFLQFTQIRYGCCGIYGFKDYRAFLLSGTTKQDVPFACCKDTMEAQDDQCPPYTLDKNGGTTLENLYDVKTIPGKTLPLPIPKLSTGTVDDVAMKDYAKELYGQRNPNNTYEWKDPKDPGLWLPVNNDKSETLWLQGCYGELRTNSENLLEAYRILCFFLISSSILMCILYFRNCLRARRFHHESLQDVILESTVKVHPQNAFGLETEVGNADPKKMLKELRHPKGKFTIQESAKGKKKTSKPAPPPPTVQVGKPNVKTA